MPNHKKNVYELISERLVSTWVLLSETNNFLSRTSIFENYENELKEIRARLMANKNNASVIQEIRKQLINIRNSLRLQGYDLALGKYELIIRGFRNDASLSQGFKRMVLIIGEKQIRFFVGSQNHIELSNQFEQQRSGKNEFQIIQKHYLWYRWFNKVLELSGADTERPEDFENFKNWASVAENRLFLLSNLKKLS